MLFGRRHDRRIDDLYAHHRKANRIRELSKAQKAANKTRSKVRTRVEHVFGDQKNGMRADIVRTIGIIRARGPS